jgi:SAM-dependent methyltransferase
VNLWDFRSVFYRALRRLPVIRGFLNAEMRNLAFLLAKADIRPERILDLGSGAGSTLSVIPRGRFRICSDKSAGMAKRLRAIDPEETVVRMDASFLPFREEAFDIVSAVGLSEYIENHAVFLAEIKRVLGRNGLLLVTLSPHGPASFLRQAHGLRIFPADPEVWEGLAAQSGFSVIGKSKSLIQRQYLLSAGKE